MGRVSRFLAVPIGDKFRLGLAVPLLLVVRVGVFVVPFATFRAALVAVASVVGRLVPGRPTPYRVAWAVDRADRTVPGHRTCLMRSLTSETMHVLYGHEIVHRIGVATDGDGDADLDVGDDGGGDAAPAPAPGPVGAPAGVEGFEAHSWIEYDGEVILGYLEDLSRFEPLPPLNETDRS